MTVEVKVAKIQRIEIFSRFKQINKGDNYHLEVRAFDDEGNAFNTMEGFKFDWAVKEGHENIMRISSKDASHSKHKEVDALNDDDYFLKTIQSGFTTIEVKILEKGHEHVASADIRLTIVEPLVILPAEDTSSVTSKTSTETYILPTSEFRFKLSKVTMTQNNGVDFHEIQVPNSQYKWALQEETQSLGKIGQDGLFES